MKMTQKKKVTTGKAGRTTAKTQTAVNNFLKKRVGSVKEARLVLNWMLDRFPLVDADVRSKYMDDIINGLLPYIFVNCMSIDELADELFGVKKVK